MNRFPVILNRSNSLSDSESLTLILKYCISDSFKYPRDPKSPLCFFPIFNSSNSLSDSAYPPCKNPIIPRDHPRPLFSGSSAQPQWLKVSRPENAETSICLKRRCIYLPDIASPHIQQPQFHGSSTSAGRTGRCSSSISVTQDFAVYFLLPIW